LIGTVKNNDPLCKTFTKILNCLSFSCTSRSLRSSTSLHVECISEGHVSSISKWSNN
jgi:hypothetical protein